MSSKLFEAAASLRSLADELELKASYNAPLPPGSDLMAAQRRLAESLPRGTITLNLEWDELGAKVGFVVYDRGYIRLADAANLSVAVDAAIAEMSKPPAPVEEVLEEALPTPVPY